MKKKILLIIAAGNASRMGYLPKAASIINGKSNLTHTCEKAYDIFDKIIVFSNHKNHWLYTRILEPLKEKVEVVAIMSGMGCGDAVLKAFEYVGTVNASRQWEYTLCWGDTHFPNNQLLKEVAALSTTDSDLIVPVMQETDPYVWFDINKLDIIRAMFSKRGEKRKVGFHDQSIFRVSFNLVYKLLAMKDVYWRKDRYQYDELIFLDVCHYMYNTSAPAKIYITKNSTMSFNTETELNDINDLLLNRKIKGA